MWYICGYPERDLIIVRVDTAVDLDSDGACLLVALTGIRVSTAGIREDELFISVERRFVSGIVVEREHVCGNCVDISGRGDFALFPSHINTDLTGETSFDIYG